MESKKKKKIILSVCIAALVVVIAAVGIFFGVRNLNKKNTNKQSATNTNISTSIITNTYNEAIADGKIPQNYNGYYKYLRIASIEFNFNEFPATDQQQFIKTICENKGVEDVNGLLNYLNLERKTEDGDSIMNFNGGRYTKFSPSKDKIIEYGEYVGDDNLSQIKLIRPDPEAYFFISLNYKIPSNAIAPNATDSNLENDGKILYVFKNFRSKSNPKRILFTVAYAYELFENKPTIPDNELDF